MLYHGVRLSHACVRPGFIALRRHRSDAPPPPPPLQRDQEDAHDFLEFLVDRMHSELAALAGTDAAGGAAHHASPAAAAAAANAAKAAAEDEWLTKSGRRLTKRQQLRGDSETAVSALMRGTFVRCGPNVTWLGGGPTGSRSCPRSSTKPAPLRHLLVAGWEGEAALSLLMAVGWRPGGCAQHVACSAQSAGSSLHPALLRPFPPWRAAR